MRSQVDLVEASCAISAWPCEADFILSTLETASAPETDPRLLSRGQFRVAAQLQFARADRSTETDTVTVYTRDVSAQGLGFIAREPLTIGQKAILHVSAPSDFVHHLECTVFRCRAVAAGWYEGAISFTRPQSELSSATTVRVFERGSFE